jgi:hypothetical protein
MKLIGYQNSPKAIKIKANLQRKTVFLDGGDGSGYF